MNLMDALNVNASTVERPAALPMGTYVWAVAGPHQIRQVKNGELEIIELPIIPISAEDDVDEDALRDFGSLSAGRNRISFMFNTDPANEADNKRTMYRLKKFLLETLQVEGGEDTTIRELLAAAPNCQFRAMAKWRQDGDNTYVDVAQPMPLG